MNKNRIREIRRGSLTIERVLHLFKEILEEEENCFEQMPSYCKKQDPGKKSQQSIVDLKSVVLLLETGKGTLKGGILRRGF